MDNSITYIRHPSFKNYFISSNGKVFSLVKGWKEKATKVSNRGYKYCSMYYEGKHYLRSVHSLVADCFLRDTDIGEINHKDKDRLNNSVDNLEIVSRSFNLRHKFFGKKRFVSRQTTTGKFQIRIKHNNKMLYTPGQFTTKEEAYDVAYNYYIQYFGFEPWSK